MSASVIKIFMAAYFGSMVCLFMFGAWMVYQDPEGVAGWVSAILAAVQLVISKMGELGRLATNRELDGGGDNGLE